MLCDRLIDAVHFSPENDNATVEEFVWDSEGYLLADCLPLLDRCVLSFVVDDVMRELLFTDCRPLLNCRSGVGESC